MANSINNYPYGDRIIISKEIEDKYGINIEIYSNHPLLIAYGEVTVIYSDETSEYHTASGGLCFSLESYGSGEERFHSIFLCGRLCTPRLSFFDTPFSQSHQSNCFPSLTATQAIKRFLLNWSRSKEPVEIRGNKDDLILFIFENQSEENFMQIRVLSEKDFYTVAAWFILVEANKHIIEKEKAPVFEMYWPECRYYHKRHEPYNLNEFTAKENEQTLILSPDTDNDLSKREAVNPLRFTRLLLSPTIGYYDENETPMFFSDVNIINIRYGDGVIRFDIVNDEVEKKIDSLQEFTFSPVLQIVRCEDVERVSRYLGDTLLDNQEQSKVYYQKADIVNAPFMSVWPIYLECKLLKREGTFQKHYEASVYKTHISQDILDQNGNIDIKRAWNQLTWEVIAPQNGDKEE